MLFSLRLIFSYHLGCLSACVALDESGQKMWWIPLFSFQNCLLCLVFMTPFMNCSSKLSKKGKAPGKAGQRFWKNVGLGFKTPREAIEGAH